MAQSGTISGVVKDEAGAPLPGVNVLVKGTTLGTSTDADGKYSIVIQNENSTIVFSFIGYLSEEETINGRSVIDITMTPDIETLSEIVIVGYGQQNKKDVTGSVAQIKSEEIADLPVAQFTQKLQGRIAGVQINQVTGIPGQGMTIRVRGSASVNAGNNPLFVIDGFPITGSINDLNPDEIENISVLKDASASSLYGSRAASGVVLITTKRAAKGETKINFNAYVGVQSLPEKGKPDMMNAREFATFQKEYREDEARYRGTPLNIPAEYQNPEQHGQGTDWYDVLTRTARIENYSISLMADKDKFRTSVVMGYFNQDGVVNNSNFKRISLRINTDYKLHDRITIGLNLAPNLTTDETPSTDGALWFGGILQNAILTSPLAPAKNPDGTLPLTATSPGLFPNPNWYRVAGERKYRTKSLRTLANVYIDFEIVKDLHFKSSINGEYGDSKTNFFIPSTSGFIFDPPPRKAEASITDNTYYSWLSENTLTYSKTFSSDHNVDALLAFTSQKYSFSKDYLYGTDFPSDQVETINAAATKNGSSEITEWALLSFVGRLNYNFRGKYLLSAAIRRDGSSRFGPNNRWGNFPSLSVGWIISDEGFMPDIKSLSYLKLRASYGLTGNNNIGDYTYFAAVNSTNYVFNGTLSNGRSVTTLGNNNLGWETTKQFDLGADIGLLDDRVNITYDYFKKNTSDMLYQVAVPRASGYSSIYTNVGEFKFWGHEFAISSKNTVSALKWSTDFNITFLRNRVEKLGTENAPIGGVDNPHITKVGEQIGMFYGYVFDGVYRNQAEFDAAPKHATSEVGTVRYRDIGGSDGTPDGVINSFDKTIIGNPNPDFIWGLVNNLAYKNFDLSIVVSGSYGNEILNQTLQYTQNLDAVFNVTKDVANRWRSEEQPGDGQHPSTKSGTTELARNINSRYVTDGSFATIKNITLGYTIPFNSTKYIKRLRVYGSVQQVLVLTSYKYGNPEVGNNGANALAQGLDFTAYPVPRTFTLGINASF
jgi:TonB-linked SusC/RagA family outer membrane protein